MKLIEKFKWAFIGLFDGLKHSSIHLQLFFAVLTVIIFSLLKISYLEWLVVVLVICLVFLAEWLNTIIELTVDYISLAIDPRAKKIKDLAAGMVLFVGLFALVIGLWILIRNLR